MSRKVVHGKRRFGSSVVGQCLEQMANRHQAEVEEMARQRTAELEDRRREWKAEKARRNAQRKRDKALARERKLKALSGR